MGFPEVSVIIPVYNGAAFIGNAIHSALEQIPRPKEIFVIDDGSTDDTAAIVSRFPSPVRLLRQKNAGPAAARNRGALHATGEWLAFLDADDVWLPGKIEAQLRLATDSSVAVISCCVTEKYFYEPPPAEISFDRLWRRNCIALSSAIVRRKVFWEFNGFDEDPALISVEDYNLWLRISAKRWRILTVQEVLCRYMPGVASLTSQIGRFARAELANLAKVGAELTLPVDKMEKKRQSLLEEYGREFLHLQELSSARSYLGRAFRSRPTLSNLLWWVAAFSPTRLLDLRRRLRIRRTYSPAPPSR